MANTVTLPLTISRIIGEKTDQYGEVVPEFDSSIKVVDARERDSVFYRSEDDLKTLDAYLQSKHMCVASLGLKDQPAQEIRYEDSDGKEHVNYRTWIATKQGLRQNAVPVITPTS